MRSKILFTLACMAMVSISFAQKMLTGKILDAGSNTPLSGATITFPGGATTSARDGSFSINCPAGNSITVSYVGFVAQKITVKDCDAILTISLTSNNRTLDVVEITATSNFNKALLYQPASIAKLTLAELKRGTGLYLDDAILTNVPGVTMNRRSVAGGQQFNIRGYGNGTRGTRGISSNFDGQGSKVYLNGIPITDAEGITTMDDIDFGSIGNVEVIKGPAGTLYGLAAAGAVNLKTTRPEKGKTSLGQEVMVGNYGLRRYTTTFQTAGERSSILLNYGHQNSDGFSIHNASKKDFVNFVGEFTPNEKQTVTTYAGYSNSYDERLGELTIDQWNNNDYSGNPDYIKRNAHSNVISFRAGVGHTYAFNKHLSNTTTVFGTGFTSNASSAAGWTDKNTINYGLRSTFDTKFELGSNATLSGNTGIETQRQDGQTIGYNMKQHPADTDTTWTLGENPYWVINANTSNTATVSKTTSLFTQWTLGLAKDLSITAGVGVSNMKLTLNDRFNPELATRPATYNKDYRGMVSPHLAINKVFSKQFSLYASYSVGYKAPVSSYFYITTPAVTNPATPATGRVNEDLKAETGRQFEIGSKGNLFNSRLSYELAWFHATFSDKMTSVAVSSPASPNTTLYSYVVNGGTQIDNGLEAQVRFTAYSATNGFVTLVRPFANFTYSDFKYGDDFRYQKSATVTEDYSSKKVAAVSPKVFNLGVDLGMAAGLYANFTYTYRDGMPITSLNDVYAGSYNLLNGKLGIRQALGKHFDIDAYLGAINLTNTKYYLMVFANQLPDAYLPAAPNANIFAGINLKYNF
ncbi:TonB-dependent receptor [Flavihumibacter profundi]|uniref:TonB-dependent receptor n=1 Tax=Flavihumibacter profundi TaxID=2716883 RepID=UPI001CC381EA|nr:TonB-dependent receptor [Flavihumibacter profundi]MBZ5857083.1 TonB-dependent receptor [Flavihumibacter profundi]